MSFYYLASEHSGELFTDALEQFLNGSCVSNKSSSHFQTTGWDVANGSLDVVGDPFNEVRAVFINRRNGYNKLKKLLYNDVRVLFF